MDLIKFILILVIRLVKNLGKKKLSSFLIKRLKQLTRDSREKSRVFIRINPDVCFIPQKHYFLKDILQDPICFRFS